MAGLDSFWTELAKHRTNGVAIDTQLLLMFWIGCFDRSLLGPAGFKRTRAYTGSDHDLLLQLIKRCPRVVTTPNVLTEVSNLAGKDAMAEEFRAECRTAIAKLNERQITSIVATAATEYPRLGLTDGTLIQLAQGGVLILTDDQPLYAHLAEERLPVMNFTHLRNAAYEWF